jgi:hypothetical protein
LIRIGTQIATTTQLNSDNVRCFGSPRKPRYDFIIAILKEAENYLMFGPRAGKQLAEGIETAE